MHIYCAYMPSIALCSLINAANVARAQSKASRRFKCCAPIAVDEHEMWKFDSKTSIIGERTRMAMMMMCRRTHPHTYVYTYMYMHSSTVCVCKKIARLMKTRLALNLLMAMALELIYIHYYIPAYIHTTLPHKRTHTHAYVCLALWLTFRHARPPSPRHFIANWPIFMCI